MFNDVSNVAESGYLLPSGLIRGNDDRGDGFGDVKRKLNDAKKKRRAAKENNDAAANDETVETIGAIRGSDEAEAPPEQPATESPNTDNKTGDDRPAVQNADGSVTLKPSELQALIAKAARDEAVKLHADVQAENRALADEVARTKQEKDQAVLAAEQKAKAAADETERIQRVLEVTGISGGGASSDNASYQRTPYSTSFNRLGSDDIPRGAAKDFIEMYNNNAYTPRKQVVDTSTGETRTATDTRHIDSFVRHEFKKDNGNQLLADMERLAKGHGLLTGGTDAALAGNTSGAAGSVPDGFLPYLSSYIRMTHAPKFIWWQFQNVQLDLAQRPGQTILVPRFEYLDEPTSEEDYILDTALASANISTDNQALIASTVPVEIKGYGLGLGTAINNRAIAIPEFIMATSMLELQGALMRNLGHHYYGFEDLMIRRTYRTAMFNTNNVFYNNQGTAVNDSTLVVDGSDGTMTEEFLASMWAQMNDADIPSLPDGKRIGVLSTRSMSQLKASLGDKVRALTEAQLQEMTNILNRTYPGGEIDRATQYFGCYEGFHLYETLSTSRGAAAGAEGVYAGDASPAGAGALNITGGVPTPANTTSVGTVTTPPANVILRDNFFFGPGATGNGVSLPMEIRQDDSNQFNTKNRYIWRSIEGWGALDVSSLDTAGAATNQQNRVFIGRTSDTIV